LTAADPFTPILQMSNWAWYRYRWVWDKVSVTNPLLSKIRPLNTHEDVLIFYSRLPVYNPQMKLGRKWHRAGKPHVTESLNEILVNRGSDKSALKFPKSILTISNANKNGVVHPTQKPVALFAYLIRTYTNPGDLVLDNTIGSGTTAIACLNTNRNFIGIEKDEEYYKVACTRVFKRSIELGKLSLEELHALYDKTDTDKQGFQLGLPL